MLNLSWTTAWRGVGRWARVLAGGLGLVAETASFLCHFSSLPDSRQPGKVIYPLNEVLLLALLAVLAGAESFTGVTRFGEKKLKRLRRILPSADRTPPHDTLDAAAFLRCLVEWVAGLTKTPVEVIAIDRKTSRRSGSKAKSKGAIPRVSPFAAPTPWAGADESEREVERDRRHSRPVRHDDDQRGGRHNRRHRLSARHIAQKIIDGRLHPRPQRLENRQALCAL